MPNVSLLPGDKDIVARRHHRGDRPRHRRQNRGSWSIDQQRYNFQFGGQVFYEIKGGKITGMLKDVAYQMRTPDSGTAWT